MCSETLFRMYQNRYLGMEIFKNFPEGDMPICQVQLCDPPPPSYCTNSHRITGNLNPHETIDLENFPQDAIYSIQSMPPFIFRSQRVTFRTHKTTIVYTRCS